MTQHDNAASQQIELLRAGCLLHAARCMLCCLLHVACCTAALGQNFDAGLGHDECVLELRRALAVLRHLSQQSAAATRSAAARHTRSRM